MYQHCGTTMLLFLHTYENIRVECKELKKGYNLISAELFQLSSLHVSGTFICSFQRKLTQLHVVNILFGSRILFLITVLSALLILIVVVRFVTTNLMLLE